MKIFLITLSMILSNNQQLDEVFNQSNDLYTNGNYEAALEGYLEIINSGFESAELYFNIGNSFYKLNNVPESNFYFEKALAISPNDKDIITNLSFAQNLRIDKIENLPITQIQNIKISVLDLLSEKGWAYSFVILVWLLCISFSLYLLLKDSRLKRTFFTLSIFISLISLSSLYLNYEKKELNNIRFAIIFDKEIEVWSEPNKISELKFLLHEGTKVKQVDLIEDWVNIQLDNGTLGWIEASSLRFLN